jgi:flagellar assembly protein FliH
MASVHKFLFEESFDTEPPYTPKVAPRKEPETPPPPPPPTFSEAELEAARKKARAEGEQAGFARGQSQARDESRASLEARLAEAMEYVAQNVSRLVAEREAQNADRAGQPLRIAMAILSKALPDLIRRNGTSEIEAFIAACLAEAIDEPRLTVRVGEELVEELRERIEAMARQRGFEGRLVILGEPGLGPADCRIDWAEGGAERDTGQLLADLEQAAERLLGSA